MIVQARQILWLSVLLISCSMQPAAECPQTGISDAGKNEVAAPPCDCIGPGGADQRCSPPSADSRVDDARGETGGPDDWTSFPDATWDAGWPEDLTYLDDTWLSDTTADCCSAADPCNLSHNGICNCGGSWAWDDWDCYLASQDTYLSDSYDDDSGDFCCQDSNPCDWADDGYCDCNGIYDWDLHDCAGWSEDAISIDVGYCDDACSYYDVSDVQENCCSEWDPCGWSNDGMCDCKGLFWWDSQDCN